MKKKPLLLGLLAFSFIACYSPDPFKADSSDDSDSSSESAVGKIYPVDGNKNESEQVCNPSVSNDTVNFPGSMLWLNFDELKVKKHDDGYSLTDVAVHDRLTVSDTANNVVWYLMRDLSKGECQFQDPEWSTHPNYIVALRAYDTKGRKACEDLDYGLFAVRMSDKKKFFFYDKDIIESASPHLWVDPEAVRDSSADDSKVEGFFGTKQVRLVYVNQKNQIVFVDFANGGLKKAKTLKKPSGVDGWMMDSPLISPDGNFVVYNAINSPSGWRSFIQELSDKSKPIEIEKTDDMVSRPVQPHWFQYKTRLFVVWTEIPKEVEFVIRDDLSSSTIQDGSKGRTVMREVSLAYGMPSDLAFAWVSSAKELAPIPMIGGRSPDGRFLATGTNNGYLLELP